VGVTGAGGGGSTFEQLARTSASALTAAGRDSAAKASGRFCEIFPMTTGKEVSNSRILLCRSTSRRAITRSMTSGKAKDVPERTTPQTASIGPSEAAGMWAR
jgi:hypothetical protein